MYVATWDHFRSKRVPPHPLRFISRHSWMSSGYHSEVSARSLEEDTEQRVRVCMCVCACVEKWKKHSFWSKEEVRLKERLSGRETALMMLKIGPWLRYTPQVNHCYSLLSTYLSPCPPHLAPPTLRLCLMQPPPPHHPDSTSFTTTYSKLPSSSHTRPVAINNCLHVSTH